MIVTGAGQISMAIARRVGYGKKIVLGDKKIENADAIAKTMNEAGFDVVPFEMDLSSRESKTMRTLRQRHFITRIMNKNLTIMTPDDII